MALPTLTLPEELMLIALRDERGTIEANAGMYAYALTGGVLTELFLAGLVEPYEREDPAAGSGSAPARS